MKKPLLFLLMSVFILGLLIQPGCKTKDDPADQYTLMVTLGTGVTGTPISGSYAYDENQAVPYSYTLQTGYVNLVVTLDGITVANSGSITMNSNHTLTATAGEPTVKYTLEVQVGTGVSGVPVAGTYPYDENEIVSYSYTLQTGYENLEVTLDGIPIADSGVITMDNHHTLKSMSDEIHEIYSQGTVLIHGTWYCDLDTGTETVSDPDCDFFWRQQTSILRSIDPMNGAEFYVVGIESLDNISYQDLEGYSYSGNSINGSNNSENEIPTGTVVACITSQGRYCKFHIDSYGYDLNISWVTYE